MTTPCLVVVDCREAVDFVLVLDGSGSVGATNFNRMLDFATSLVQALPGDVRMGLVTFDNNHYLEFHLNT